MFGMISSLADNLVTKLTGSDALGDIVGLGVAVATGDAWGVAKQGLDLADNVVAGAGTFAKGVWGAAKDAVKAFSNPGQVYSPSQYGSQYGGMPNSGWCGTPGMGMGGGFDPFSGIGQQPPFNPGQFTEPFHPVSSPSTGGMFSGIKNLFGNSEDNEINSILGNGALSFETKIMLVLMAMQKKKRQQVMDHMLTANQKQVDAAGFGTSDVDRKKAAEATSQQNTAQAMMQEAANSLSQLQSLATNLQKAFHDSKMATIQNIR